MAGTKPPGLWSLYWSIAKDHRKPLLVGLIALIAVNLLELLPPLALGLLIDSVSGKNRSWTPGTISIAYIGVFALQATIRYPVRLGFIGSSARIAATLREQYSRRLLQATGAALANHQPGDLMSRATVDLGMLEGAMSTGLLFLCDCVIYLLCIPAVVIWETPSLFLYSLPPLLAIPVLAQVLITRIVNASQEAQEAYGRVTSKVHENAGCVQTVRSYGLEERETSLLETLNQKYVALDLRRASLEARFAGLVQLLIAGSVFIVLWCGGREAVTRQLSLGRFVTLLQYMGMMAWPLTGLSWAFLLFRKGETGLRRFQEILDLPVEAASGTLSLPHCRGSLRVQDLTYSYPGAEAPALSRLSLTIPPGKRVAILGPVGSGKTTLLNLLVRRIEPPPGTVWIDGLDATSMDLDTARRHLAVAPQDGFIFSGSIRDNIAAGSSEASIVEASAIAAQIEGSEFPLGLETAVGQQGGSLSGGQRQRVSIARALARQSSIVILDDATSALDLETEERLFSRLGAQTVVFTTHRVQLARRADWIVILSKGSVVEEGSPEELSGNGGLFARWAQSGIDADACPQR